MLLSTTETISGKTIVKVLGVVRGNSVRARWFGSDIMAGLKNLVGGEINQYMDLMTEARELAVKRMNEDAKKLGADAIVGVRFTTSQIMDGASEILVYGTAVTFKKK